MCGRVSVEGVFGLLLKAASVTWYKAEISIIVLIVHIDCMYHPQVGAMDIQTAVVLV